jgi:hypothetical protein
VAVCNDQHIIRRFEALGLPDRIGVELLADVGDDGVESLCDLLW